jgi:hypothetical protein
MQTPPRKPTPQQVSQLQELPTGVTSQPQYNKEVPPVPRSNSTSGGRPIPPRSDLRSPGPPPAAVGAIGGIPPRSERRRSQELQIRPLNTGYHPTHDHNGSIDLTLATSPVSPVAAEATPNYSRPGGRKESVMSAVRGIHGAGDAIRGTINGTLAKGVGDKGEQERAQAIREQGLNDFRGSGLREGFREKAEGRLRLRRRSGSANRTPGSAAPDGLEKVDEVSI